MECLRLVYGKELPVPKGWSSLLPMWEPQVTITRNSRIPEVWTPGSQPGNHGYHCKELPVPRGWNSWFPTWEPWVTTARNCRLPEVGTHTSQSGNHRLPLQATAGSQRLELMLPNLGTIGYHCKQPPVPRPWLETYGSQPGNQRLLLQGIAGSQKLEFMFSKLSGYHCKNCGFPKLETHGS